LSDAFYIQNGLNLLPFNFNLDYALRKMQEKKRDIKIIKESLKNLTEVGLEIKVTSQHFSHGKIRII
jgi:hypothetical protein